jgi:hypothetical protein
MDEFLRLHKPSGTAKKRAEAAHISLTELKETDPTRYKMMVAQSVLEVSPELEQPASNIFFAAFKHHEVFRLEQPTTITLLVFPELLAKDLARLDKALGNLAELPKLKERYAYFRTVTDKTGEHRQLAFPISPVQWTGQTNLLIGPFANQSEAQTWGNETVRPQNLIHDTLNHAGVWLCDVFLSE